MKQNEGKNKQPIIRKT